jgi:hypothetical protein
MALDASTISVKIISDTSEFDAAFSELLELNKEYPREVRLLVEMPFKLFVIDATVRGGDEVHATWRPSSYLRKFIRELKGRQDKGLPPAPVN